MVYLQQRFAEAEPKCYNRCIYKRLGKFHLFMVPLFLFISLTSH